MVQTCCITGCKTRKTPGDKLSFYNIPKDEEMKKKWAEVIGLKCSELSSHMRVCAKHFSADCYTSSQWRANKYLKEDAVPTIDACYSTNTSESLDMCLEADVSYEIYEIDSTENEESCESSTTDVSVKDINSLQPPETIIQPKASCESGIVKSSTPQVLQNNFQVLHQKQNFMNILVPGESGTQIMSTAFYLQPSLVLLPQQNFVNVVLTNSSETTDTILPDAKSSALNGTENMAIEIKSDDDSCSESSLDETPFEFVSADNFENRGLLEENTSEIDVSERQLTMNDDLVNKSIPEIGVLETQLTEYDDLVEENYKAQVKEVFERKDKTIELLKQTNKELEDRVNLLQKLVEEESKAQFKRDGPKMKKRKYERYRLDETALEEEKGDDEIYSDVDELELELEKLYES